MKIEALINNSVCFNNDKTNFSVRHSPDGDIYFSSSDPNMVYRFRDSIYAKDEVESSSNIAFRDLMREIIGQYVLEKDIFLPPHEDFVNLKNKTITVHSDEDYSNCLKLHFDNHDIEVSLTQGSNSKQNYIRLRRSGGDYISYLPCFYKFFEKTHSFAKDYERSSSER